MDEHRQPRLKISDETRNDTDDTFWPLLGYHVGKLASADIPLIFGLENASPRISGLKAFGAAFATTASAPMFHITGITTEAGTTDLLSLGLPCYEVGIADLKLCWSQLNIGKDSSLGLVSLANPHFSLE